MVFFKVVIELASLEWLRYFFPYKMASENSGCNNQWEDIWKLLFYYKVKGAKECLHLN